MAKKLFKSKSATVRKKMTIFISSENAQRLAKLEEKAEIAGVSFPVQEHLEEALERLIMRAERELDEIDEPDMIVPHGSAVGPDGTNV